MINRFLFIPFALLLAVAAVSGCSEQAKLTDAMGGVSTLVQTDVVVGEGEEARAGHSVQVHYTGWLYDESAVDKKGAKFDSSRDRNQPFAFPLGAGRVIQGWDQGVAGMKVGGQRTLLIPARLGYGAKGAGRSIPPNASLLFEVELLNLR